MQDGQPLKLRAETRLVEVVVTVRDAQGHPIKGLRKSDFTLFDNNKSRAFTIFSANDFNSSTPNPSASPSANPPAQPQPQPNLPPNTFTNTRIAAPPPEGHSTIILLDGVNGWFDSFAWGAQGVEGLMNKLPPDEKIAIYVNSHYLGLELLQDYTTDHAKALHAVATFLPRGMHPAPPAVDPPDGHGMMEGPVGRGASASGSGSGPRPPDASKPTPREMSYDLQRGSESVRLSLQALAEKLRALPGRKSVFWITEGFPPRQLRGMNQFAWDKTISALNDANIAVNTVDADGLGGPPRLWGWGAILSMQQIAEQTGGQAFFHTNDLAAAMATGIEDSRSSYTLAFYLSEVDGKYHDLKVKVDRPKVQLAYRQGYWARSEAAADLEARKSDLSGVLLNPIDSVGVGLTATLDIADTTLTAHVRIDSDSLSVKQSPTGWIGKVDEVFIEFNPAGREVGRVTVTKVFEIEAAQKSSFDAHGALISQPLRLAPGASRLSIAVRDTASGRTGSLTIPLDRVTASHQ
jgi:VWFA-related protein